MLDEVEATASAEHAPGFTYRDPAHPAAPVWCSGQRRADTVVMAFWHRLATFDDLVMLEAVIDAAISDLQRGFLSRDEIESSRAIMGIDTQLITDGTYHVVLAGEAIAGCGRLEPQSDVVRR